nr:MAG TPA: hypothetical protein [Caudoviricetes sp.]
MRLRRSPQAAKLETEVKTKVPATCCLETSVFVLGGSEFRLRIPEKENN